MKKIYARQGDLVIERFEGKCPELASKENPVLAGSHDGAHTVVGTVDYAQVGREHFVRAATDTQMSHSSRHKAIPLSAGVLYRITPQIERRGDGDTDVQD